MAIAWKSHHGTCGLCVVIIMAWKDSWRWHVYIDSEYDERGRCDTLEAAIESSQEAAMALTREYEDGEL